jgi:hypothetical protein
MLARSGRNNCLPERGVEYCSFRNDAASLVVDIRWVLQNSADLSSLALARSWVGYVDRVYSQCAQLQLSAAPTFPRNVRFANDCFRGVASHLKGTFTSEDVFLSARFLALMQISMPLRHYVI